MLFKFQILIVCLLISVTTLADSDLDDAIFQTQKDMRQKDLLNDKASLDTTQAKQAAEMVKSIAGSKNNEQEIMNLSADILENFKDKSPDEIMKILIEAQKDPSSFANSWTPEQRKKLEEISNHTPMSKNMKRRP